MRPITSRLSDSFRKITNEGGQKWGLKAGKTEFYVGAALMTVGLATGIAALLFGRTLKKQPPYTRPDSVSEHLKDIGKEAGAAHNNHSY
ncbi:MAG: hypothetical protein R6U50_12705 [Desulfobacterales bacterium]